MGWVAYQLNWICQRHAFLTNPGVSASARSIDADVYTPWQLRLLGERDPLCISVPQELAHEAHRLFPGVAIEAFDPDD